MKTLAVTRPKGEGADTARFIHGLGWTPLIVHTVELRPRPGSKVLSELRNATSAGPPDWLVFMSPRGVDLFFDILESQNSPLPDFPGQSRVLAVGPKTKSSLRRQGIQKVDTPSSYSSDGVADFLKKIPLQNKRVILARSSQASGTLARRLRARGALVATIPLYESSIPSDRESVSSFLIQLRSGTVHATLFTSALSAANLFEMSKPQSTLEELRELLTNCHVGAIGPTTAAQLRKLGVMPAFIPERFTIGQALTGLVSVAEKKPAGIVPSLYALTME